jgi:hypothetical protein
MKDVVFHVEGNAISSEEYKLIVVAVPTISNFEMQLNYPSYLNKKAEVVKEQGTVIPEGTKVTWKINSLATENIVYTEETTFRFKRKKMCFHCLKMLFKTQITKSLPLIDG